MQTLAIVLDAPERIAISEVSLIAPGPDDVVVAVEWSGISTGTEKLLYSGRMPPFPGMGYPLVPGYESVGRIVEAPHQPHRIGERVFVGGARCFENVHALFGGAAHRLIVPADKAISIPESLGEKGVLLALAATAHHALTLPGSDLPQLIIGHGVLGRLCARLVVALGGTAPTVWEQDETRRTGHDHTYELTSADLDPRRDYSSILDVSGDPTILDRLTARLAPRGEIILAGFYDQPLSFSFPQAFMREARFRIAAEFKPHDIAAVNALIASGGLSLNDLITHRSRPDAASAAYATAFADRSCLKMILDWRKLQ